MLKMGQQLVFKLISPEFASLFFTEDAILGYLQSEVKILSEKVQCSISISTVPTIKLK